MEMDPLMHFALICALAVAWFVLHMAWDWMKGTPVYGYVVKVVGRLRQKPQ